MRGSRTTVISAAIGHIEEHLTENLDLAAVADAVHYSKFHLHRMFAAAVGLTVHDYHLRRRLTEAAKLLVFSRKPIVDIALLAGYESQQAFTAAFRAMYKQAPGAFRRGARFYPLQLRFTLKEDPGGDTSADVGVGPITFAKEADIPAWMELVRLTVDGFPAIDLRKYREVLARRVRERRALIQKDGETAIGAMIVGRETGSIEFFSVHPQYRSRGVMRAFLNLLTAELLPGREISVTTFRAGDRADTGYREAYRQLGFAARELLVEYGYPTQRFAIGPRENGKDPDV